jgi:plastocyanin
MVVIVVAIIVTIAASVALYSSYAVQINSGSTSTLSSTVTRISSSTQSSSASSTTTTTNNNNSASAVLVLIPYGVYANQQLNFEPSNLKVLIGVNNTVRWVNKDYTLHTISILSSPNNSSTFESGPIFQGGSLEYTFAVPGQYAYYCPWHPGWMRGTVTVLAPKGEGT